MFSVVARKGLAVISSVALTAAFAVVGTSSAHAAGIAVANIRLSAGDKLGMSNKTSWDPNLTKDGATNAAYTKFVTRRGALTLHYQVTDGSGAGIANTVVSLGTSAPEGATSAVFTGDLVGTTDGGGNVTFTLANNNFISNTEPRPIGASTMFYWDDPTRKVRSSENPDAFIAQELDFVPTVGATTENTDRVWSHIVAAPIADVAYITLSSSDTKTMSTKNQWYQENAKSNSYVKFVTVGDTLNLHYTVLDADKNPLKNAAVELTPSTSTPEEGSTKIIDTAGFTGALVGTTDCNGQVTFSLTNTSDPSATEPRPTFPSNMSVWDDNTRILDHEYSRNFLPSVGAETEYRDRVWAHVVAPAATAGVVNIHLTSAAKATMTNKDHWWNVGTAYGDSSDVLAVTDASSTNTSHNYAKFTDKGGVLTLNYQVTNSAGTPISNKVVTLSAVSAKLGASFTGSKTATSDANGLVTFSLTNTNSQAEPRPLAPSTMSWWDEDRDVVLAATGKQYEMDFTPTVGAETEHVDRVWAHVVEPKAFGAPAWASVKRASATSAVLSWGESTESGSATPVSYTYTLKNGSTVVGSPVTVNATSVTVTGLTSIGTYSVSVIANYDGGESVPTVSAGTVAPSATPATKPVAVTASAATAGVGSAVLTWTVAATTNGGASITGYSVGVFAGSTLVKTVALPGNTSVLVSGVAKTGALIGDLTNGTSYTFAVTATNVVGSTAAAATTAVIPAGAPNAPGNVTVARSTTGALSVSWTKPAANGSAIVSYTVLAKNGTVIKTLAVKSTADSVSGVVKLLTNGTPYVVTVTATNAKNVTGPASTPVTGTPAIVSGKPASVVPVAGNGKVDLSWTAPAPVAGVTEGGSAVTGYAVQALAGKTLVGSPVVVGSCGSVRAASVTGLANGTAYTFSITAINAVGSSLPLVSAATTPSGVPVAAPTALVLTNSGTSLKVDWTIIAATAAANGGSAVTGYDVNVYTAAGALIKSGSTAGAVIKTLTLTSVASGALKVTVTAKNKNGSGPASAEKTITH